LLSHGLVVFFDLGSSIWGIVDLSSIRNQPRKTRRKADAMNDKANEKVFLAGAAGAADAVGSALAPLLRYGQLYGPGTESASPAGASPLHVEAAAWAALLALQKSAGGIYNFADEGAEVDCGKARREQGWRPALRLAAEAVQ
jgi:hypothetical protein